MLSFPVWSRHAGSGERSSRRYSRCPEVARHRSLAIGGREARCMFDQTGSTSASAGGRVARSSGASVAAGIIGLSLVAFLAAIIGPGGLIAARAATAVSPEGES
jgi:hypothetical protein